MAKARGFTACFGKMKEEFDLIICSFALHLAPESMLPNILYNLNTKHLLILSPHKKPIIKDFFFLEKNVHRNKIHLKYFEKTSSLAHY